MSKFWLGFLVLMSLVLVLAGCEAAPTVVPVTNRAALSEVLVDNPSLTA